MYPTYYSIEYVDCALLKNIWVGEGRYGSERERERYRQRDKMGQSKSGERRDEARRGEVRCRWMRKL